MCVDGGEGARHVFGEAHGVGEVVDAEEDGGPGVLWGGRAGEF